MKNSRNLLECLYKFVNTLDDKELEKLCSGEYAITLDKGPGKKSRDVKKTKDVKKAKVEKKVSVDISKFEDLHKEVLSCKSRDEAKKVLEEAGFKKNDLLAMGEFLKVKIPKSYNKGKIIGMLVEVIVGNKIDDESIC